MQNFGIVNLLLSIISGILLALAFPCFNLNLLAWVAFIPLFFIINRVSWRKALIYSYISGLIFFLISIFWLTNVTGLGWFVLCLYLAIYFAIFGLSVCFLLKTKPRFLVLLLIIPCLWVTLELIRSHLLTGFGWNSLGYSQFKNLNIIQIADFSSVYGVSFLIIFVNFVLWMIIQRCRQRLIKDAFLLLGLLICSVWIVFSYSSLRLKSSQAALGKFLRVSVIQPNISQNLKWDPRAREYILTTLRDLTKQAARDKPDLIIWPESAIPDFLTDDPDSFLEILEFAKELKLNLLTGVIKYKGDIFYNSAILINSRGRLVSEYDKLHLVPYGEYIPLRKFTPFFLAAVVGIGDFTPGKEFTIFELAGKDQVKFAVLICFEDAFSDLSRNFTQKGARVLINITNDAWFGKSNQPEQHLSQSVFRAVENRVSVLRCANTGISGQISPRGQVENIVSGPKGEEIFIPGFKTFTVINQPKIITIFARFGDLFAYVCFAFCLIYSLYLKKERINEKPRR
jgi:apolipoprotein N-acyltransferase